MEFRWLVRTALTPRALLPYTSTSFPPSASKCAIRTFSSSSHPSVTAPPPLPTATETATTATTTTTATATATATTTTTATATATATATSTDAPAPKPDVSMADLFNIVARAAPKHRDFASILTSDLTSTNPSGPPLGARVVPRTGPAAGRSITVTNDDLPFALSRLRLVLTANSVKADQARQRFHERPGLKKKRLKSARHRRRFKAGFKKLVAIAMDMKRKGL